MKTEVILTSNIVGLGAESDHVKVAAGYARNFLFPSKLAIVAWTGSAKRLAHEKRNAEHKAKLARAGDEAVAQKLGGYNLTIARKVGDQDKLYGSVTASDLEEALKAAGFSVSRRKIQLHEPIKALGMYKVAIRLHADVKPEIKVWVIKG